jgi:predicted RNase H-like nuclease (RuvC/YqgF family)
VTFNYGSAPAKKLERRLAAQAEEMQMTIAALRKQLTELEVALLEALRRCEEGSDIEARRKRRDSKALTDAGKDVQLLTDQILALTEALQRESRKVEQLQPKAGLGEPIAARQGRARGSERQADF